MGFNDRLWLDIKVYPLEGVAQWLVRFIGWRYLYFVDKV